VSTASDAAEAGRLIAAAPAAERVALVDSRFVGHVHALRLALTDPRFPAAATAGALTVQPEVRGALVRAVGAAAHGGPQPATTAARTRADSVAGPQPASTTTLAADAPLADQVADALDAGGTGVQRTELGSLVAAVPADAKARAEAEAAVAAVDDEAVRLRSAVKARDGFFTTFFISPYSRYIARWCARRGLTPNQVTTASLLTALIAAGCAATGTRGGYVAAGVLLLFSFVLDCTDGQLARYSLQYSTMGAWLDATFDRAKEYAYYAGLALGAARGGDDVWALALGAMVLQICRHVVDFSFNEANHDATAAGKAVVGTPTAALSSRLDSVGWTVWLRRMIVLPIGERWAMIAVLTALTTPRIVFYALLAGCGFAACYTTAGRVLRSVTRRAIRTDRAVGALADLADSGPLAEAVAAVFRRPARRLPGFAPFVVALAGGAAVVATAAFTSLDGPWPVVAALVYVLTSGLAVARPLGGALDWLVPPVFRAAEYGTVLVLAARSDVHGALPAAFGLVSAVAYHHYDTVYRIRGGTGAPPRLLVRVTGGHEGRTLVVTALAAVLVTRDGDFTLALTVFAAAVALVVLAESIRFWVSSAAPAVHDEGEPA
jgi:phosphatidylglycerophosphate synthase